MAAGGSPGRGRRAPRGARRQITEASLARSCVTAPVLVEGRVVGLRPADCYFQRRDVDDSDRDLLETFAAGYERCGC